MTRPTCRDRKSLPQSQLTAQNLLLQSSSTAREASLWEGVQHGKANCASTWCAPGGWLNLEVEIARLVSRAVVEIEGDADLTCRWTQLRRGAARRKRADTGAEILVVMRRTPVSSARGVWRRALLHPALRLCAHKARGGRKRKTRWMKRRLRIGAKAARPATYESRDSTPLS